MSVRWEEETRRLATLARLALGPGEAAALASACEAVTREFGDLAAYAATLPPAPEGAPGVTRADVAEPAPEAEVEAILALAPKRDGRLVRAPRGLP